MNKAVFFDKDGVLNTDKGFSKNWDNIELYNGVGDIIKYLRDLGFKIFVVTNQTAIARGLLKEDELNETLRIFQSLILNQNKDAIIDKIYYCSHHPNADVKSYRIDCECRKPKPGMFIQASKEFDIDLKKSFMVGDRVSDIVAGHLAGCITVQCQTGKHNDDMIETSLDVKMEIKPDYTINKLEELKNIIL